MDILPIPSFVFSQYSFSGSFFIFCGMESYLGNAFRTGLPVHFQWLNCIIRWGLTLYPYRIRSLLLVCILIYKWCNTFVVSCVNSCTCTWRPERYITYSVVSLSLSLFPWDRASHWAWSSLIYAPSQAGWPVAPLIFLCSCLPVPLPHWSQSLIFAQQALLTHISSYSSS